MAFFLLNEVKLNILNFYKNFLSLSFDKTYENQGSNSFRTSFT